MPFDHLQRAREVSRPSRNDMLMRAPSATRFWLENDHLFKDAWVQWDQASPNGDLLRAEEIFSEPLRRAIAQAWDDPSSEAAVKDLWEEVLPGVFQAQFFDPEQIAKLRAYFDRVTDADIPLRPPYGIALNRGGAMLDERSPGYLAAPSFQAFYRDIMNTYMRPVARLLFPETFGYDGQTFGFSIRYQPDQDTSLQPHTDASSVTLNINMNLPNETFEGSELNFYDKASGEVKQWSFQPGIAVIHRGSVPHAAQPITGGERSNLVLWLYGDGGRTPAAQVADQSVSAEERWTVPNVRPDSFAPF
ncbi:MAG: 2OG-Fe(II) oxygenase family protein [Pseudomonadota bacterium]